MDILKLSNSVYQQICGTIGKLPPECGGILGSTNGSIITEFYFDKSGKSSVTRYAPDVFGINNMLIHDWMPRGIFMVGIVHSHANKVLAPSCGDISYGIRILQALDTVDKFYLPIVTNSNGVIKMSCYGIYHDPERQFVCKKLPHYICDT